MFTYFIARLYFIFAVADPCDKGGTFLGIFPKWYEYLPTQADTLGKCEINVQLRTAEGIDLNPLLPIGLAVLDLVLRLAGLVAVGYVIYGGFRYITSQGEPDNTKSARQTILNALIGGVIVIIASSVVAFIGDKIS